MQGNDGNNYPSSALMQSSQQAHSTPSSATTTTPESSSSTNSHTMQPADIIIKQGDLETILEEAEELTIADYSLVPGGRNDNHQYSG